jgi:hypothetical protein
MKNLVGVRVADAAEQMWVGQRTLQRVITAPERFGKRCEIDVHHLDPSWIVLSKLGLTLDDMQRRLPLGTRLGKDQSAILKVECEQADFSGD